MLVRMQGFLHSSIHMSELYYLYLLHNGLIQSEFKNRILRRIFGSKGMRIWSEGSTIRNFIICTVHVIRGQGENF